MALKTSTREIGGKTYSVTQLGSDDGQRLFFKLVKLVGPSAAALLRQWQASTDAEGKPSVSADMAAAGLAELVRGLEWSDFRDFVDTCMKSTVLHGEKDGRPTQVSLDKMKALAFAGDYGSLCKWLGFCLEVNFASFFDDMGLTRAPVAAGEP